jgi:transitional endoplasmic reticulum ATPase
MATQQSLADKQIKQVHTVQIVQHDGQLMLPRTMTPQQALDALARHIQREEEWVDVMESIPYSVFDGAYGLEQVMVEMFGYAHTEGSPFEPPRIFQVPNSPTTTIGVSWGKYRIPGSDSKDFIETHYAFENNAMVFALAGKIRRKYEPTFKAIATNLRTFLASKSLYKGKAIKVDFTDDKGRVEEMVQPTFMDVAGMQRSELVFRKDIEDAINTNVLAPLMYADGAKNMGVPLKRGVIFLGPYGTGKTLLMKYAAKVAQENGWNFLYIRHPRDLPYAIAWAKHYGKTVIATEDIDRATAGEARTTSIDEILNTLDGIDTKGAPIMTMLTTNHYEDINAAMKRPGRLDAKIEVLPPDAEAVQRLVQLYARNRLAPGQNLVQVGEELKGQIPAVIREAVERAKLAFLWRVEGNTAKVLFTADDLLVAAKQVRAEQELNTRKPSEKPTAFSEFGTSLGKEVVQGVRIALAEQGAAMPNQVNA